MDPFVSSVAGRAVLLLVLLGLVSAAWWVHSRRSGTVRAPRASAPPGPGQPADQALLAVLSARGVALGDRATFVQLSSEVCTPCRRTAAVLTDLAALEPGVTHVELDAAEHMELGRHLRVLRTPTVLLLDPVGHETGRSSGAMTLVQARAALIGLPSAAGSPPPARAQPAHLPTLPPTEETRRS